MKPQTGARARFLAALMALGEAWCDLAEENGATVPRSPEHATAKNNPLGSARSFLDAARAGRFKTFKRGRELVARWADVVAAIEARPVQRRPAPASPVKLTGDDALRQHLADAGVAPFASEAARRQRLEEAGALPRARRKATP